MRAPSMTSVRRVIARTPSTPVTSRRSSGAVSQRATKRPARRRPRRRSSGAGTRRALRSGDARCRPDRRQDRSRRRSPRAPCGRTAPPRPPQHPQARPFRGEISATARKRALIRRRRPLVRSGGTTNTPTTPGSGVPRMRRVQPGDRVRAHDLSARRAQRHQFVVGDRDRAIAARGSPVARGGASPRADSVSMPPLARSGLLTPVTNGADESCVVIVAASTAPALRRRLGIPVRARFGNPRARRRL